MARQRSLPPHVMFRYSSTPEDVAGSSVILHGLVRSVFPECRDFFSPNEAGTVFIENAIDLNDPEGLDAHFRNSLGESANIIQTLVNSLNRLTIDFLVKLTRWEHGGINEPDLYERMFILDVYPLKEYFKSLL